MRKLPTAVALVFVVGLLGGCAGSHVARSLQDVHAVTSTSGSSQNLTPLEKEIQPLVQAAGGAFPPWSELALSLIAGISGLAYGVIQTVRKQQAVASHQKAVLELAGKVSATDKQNLTVGTLTKIAEAAKG